MQDTSSIKAESTTVRQVALELVFMALALVAVKFFLMNTPVMSVLIGVLIVARFLLIGRKHDWIFFMIGFIGGGGNDLMSMIKGVYEYTPPHLLPAPIPIWMLVFWGQIFVSFRQLFQLPQFQCEPMEGKPWKLDKRLIVDLITVVVLRIIIYNFVRQEPIPTIGYSAVIILRLIVLPPKKYEWQLMVVSVLLGVAYEAALIGFGLYIYYDAIFLGMPAWLIIYWIFMLPVFVKGIYDRIELTLAAKAAGVPPAA